MRHVTVLQQEATAVLNLSEGSVVVDCTLGSGGHAETILSVIGDSGVYVGIDADVSAIEANADLPARFNARVHLVHENFQNLEDILQTLSVHHVDAILADLGWRMEQFDGSSGIARGFSFKKDEPLYMTYGNPSDYAFTAQDIVNEWGEADIANVLFGYGQERFARRIAKRIVQQRIHTPITSSMQLAEIITQAIPSSYRRGRTHPATKSFQALRIAVNDEFETLQTLLQSGMRVLAQHGRMAVISFHSLEDRIVKHTFREFVRDHIGVLVHKKPITASLEEQKRNPRSRSAKLRTIEKIA